MSERCEFYAMCDHDADGITTHPILGAVPTCLRCAERHDLALIVPTAQTTSALRSLRAARSEVAEMIESDAIDELSSFVEQLVPFAEIIAKHEQHGDVHLVLERELEL